MTQPAKSPREKEDSAGWRIAEAPARERLLKDQFEIKLQELQTELNAERLRYAKQLKKIKEKMDGCICGKIRLKQSKQNRAPSLALPERWRIRNSR